MKKRLNKKSLLLASLGAISLSVATIGVAVSCSPKTQQKVDEEQSKDKKEELKESNNDHEQELVQKDKEIVMLKTELESTKTTNRSLTATNVGLIRENDELKKSNRQLEQQNKQLHNENEELKKPADEEYVENNEDENHPNLVKSDNTISAQIEAINDESDNTLINVHTIHKDSNTTPSKPLGLTEYVDEINRATLYGVSIADEGEITLMKGSQVYKQLVKFDDYALIFFDFNKDFDLTKVQSIKINLKGYKKETKGENAGKFVVNKFYDKMIVLDNNEINNENRIAIYNQQNGHRPVEDVNRTMYRLKGLLANSQYEILDILITYTENGVMLEKKFNTDDVYNTLKNKKSPIINTPSTKINTKLSAFPGF